MKYAFMSFSTPELSLQEMLDAATRFGYDGIEPRAGSGHAHGVELEASAAQREQVRATAVNNGIALCCLAVSCRYADPAHSAAEVEETHRYIDLAADVGAPRLRVFGGQLPQGFSRESAIDHVAAALSSLADHAGERNVTICLETHDDWCDPMHVAAMMARVDHPNVAVNWDIMHPVRAAGYTMDQAYEELRPWMRHVHVHDGSLRTDTVELLPIGRGDFDHRRALQLLAGADYNGFISGEWIGWTPWQEHLPAEIATLRGYESEFSA